VITKSHWQGIPSRFYQSIQRRVPYYRRAVVRERNISFDPNILKIPRHAYLIGYWQSEKYFKPIETIIRKEFQLKRSLSTIGSAWAKKINDCISVSLHIRRGDYITDLKTHQVHGVCSLDYYQKAVDDILQSTPDAKFFIFSDDLDWVRQNVDFIRSAEYVEIEEDTQDEEELILMSLCQHHIIANSSYSWWGAWLGDYSKKSIYAPRQWFAEIEVDPTSKYPSGWILI